MFISWAVPAAICTIAAAETPVHSFGVATASHPASSSSLWLAEDDKSYNRLLQEAEIQTSVAIDVDEDHDHDEEGHEVDEEHDEHDHDEEGHDDHKDDLAVVSSDCRIHNL